MISIELTTSAQSGLIIYRECVIIIVSLQPLIPTSNCEQDQPNLLRSHANHKGGYQAIMRVSLIFYSALYP